jgi:putative aldouronate transport system substrate-binding protein
VFASCSGGSDTNEPTPTASSAPAPSASGTDASAAPSEAPSSEIKLPLSAEPVTFTMWGCTPQAGADLVTENDSYARQELEKRTNVHIEWTHPTLGQETAQFNLMLASGTLTDAITASFGYYTGGMDKYINDGFILPLESYGQYYPNYNEWRAKQDLTLLSTVTDGGHIAGIHQLRVPYQPQWQGPIVREDLLDDIGFNGTPDDIVTLSDWENVLTLFKNSGKKVPYLMPAANNGLDPFILASFGLYAAGGNTGFYQLENKVHYFPYEDSFREYLALMNSWFSKGLIDTEFFSRDMPTSQAALLSGDVGIGSTYKALYDYANFSTAGEGVHWAGISAPLKTAGQKFDALYALTSRMYYQQQVLTISNGCAEDLIPIILQYTDYGFTDEGSTLYTYGVEGQAYDIVNGEIKLRDVVTKNPDGFSLNQAFNKYCVFHSAVYRYDWKRSENNISDEAKQIYTKWEKNYAEDAAEYPPLSIGEADASAYASQFNDIDTYVKEFTMKIITGQGNLDKEWSGFKSQLDSMGVSNIIAMQQKALDGFYNRDTSLGFQK